ncbi:MAG TPA: sigma-54-dependent Fis family transcriptional regulator [Bacteroidales bacterium]|nr:sigma-54-dependent Fis family transcriptional regulator [Bacteroidales bacterium]
MDIESIKQRFGIIGNSPLLNRAIDVARQVASTDLTVLVTGESGTGKEFFPQIIHQLSPRKHGPYIAVNCGAIPEGTIDSELFGHEKGSFTGAFDSRKGYFEVVDGGTIFLDEVAELPLSTQVRLLRVLETGEFIRVGSSKVLKTDVRVVAATNINILEAIERGKFRQDLYYRLNSVPIFVPPLRDRKEDIYLLFRKLALDFAEKYRMPPIQLDEEAQQMMINYYWPGNIRQLKNITEQISIIEEDRLITANILKKYLPDLNNQGLPVPYHKESFSTSNSYERDLLFKVLFEMKNDLNDLKRLLYEIINQNAFASEIKPNSTPTINKLVKDFKEDSKFLPPTVSVEDIHYEMPAKNEETLVEPEVIDDSLSLQKKEIELIKRALAKHKGKRKGAAAELGISERTLYRKIKEFNLE